MIVVVVDTLLMDRTTVGIDRLRGRADSDGMVV